MLLCNANVAATRKSQENKKQKKQKILYES